MNATVKIAVPLWIRTLKMLEKWFTLRPQTNWTNLIKA